MPRLGRNSGRGKTKDPPIAPALPLNQNTGAAPSDSKISWKGKGNAKTPSKHPAPTKKSKPAATPITKRKKRGEDVDPLFVDPPDDAYAPYFQDFKSKRAPNFTAVKDITLYKAYAAVSEEPTVGTDQTTETFWNKIFESFVVLSGTEAGNGQFFKRSPKSMRDRYMQTIQPSINIFNQYFKNVKSRNISGVGGDDELYDIAVQEFEETEGKPFQFVQCAKLLHKMPRYNPMIELEKIILADKTEVLQGEASNLAMPMGAQLNLPIGVKSAKKIKLNKQNNQSQVHKAKKSLDQMAASHVKMASVMARKQCFIERQGQIATLWKLQEYYASKNDFVGMARIVEKIEKLTEMLSDNEEDHRKSDCDNEVNAEIEDNHEEVEEEYDKECDNNDDNHKEVEEDDDKESNNNDDISVDNDSEDDGDNKSDEREVDGDNEDDVDSVNS